MILIISFTEEIQEAIDRLHRYRVQVQIDMLPEEMRSGTPPDYNTIKKNVISFQHSINIQSSKFPAA